MIIKNLQSIEKTINSELSSKIQNSSIYELYQIEKKVKEASVALNDPKLLLDWQKLTTSDHFYYMCTKWFNDGDVHKYFSPYDSPYDSFIAFMNVLQDLNLRADMEKIKEQEKEIKKKQLDSKENKKPKASKE